MKLQKLLFLTVNLKQCHSNLDSKYNHNIYRPKMIISIVKITMKQMGLKIVNNVKTLIRIIPQTRVRQKIHQTPQLLKMKIQIPRNKYNVLIQKDNKYVLTCCKIIMWKNRGFHFLRQQLITKNKTIKNKQNKHPNINMKNELLALMTLQQKNITLSSVHTMEL